MVLVRLVVGWLMIGVGAVVLPTPVPVGLILVVVGLALVAPRSRTLQGWLRRRRAAHPGLSARLVALAPRLPRAARRVLEMTDPAPDRGRSE